MTNQSMSAFGLVGACRGLSGLVGACGGLSRVCGEFVGSLSGLVGTCRDLSSCRDLWGVVGNVDFLESHFEGIAIVVDKISAEFPTPEILRSVPEARSRTQKRIVCDLQ